MKFSLEIKPLTSNRAWRGRRFSTPAKEQFEHEMQFRLPRERIAPGPFYRVAYDFHIRTFFASDADNLIKTCQDCLVKRGIIDDDKLIIDMRVRKFPAKVDRIDFEIEPCQMEIL